MESCARSKKNSRLAFKQLAGRYSRSRSFRWASINSLSFTSFGKNVELEFQNIITEKDINAEDAFGKSKRLQWKTQVFFCLYLQQKSMTGCHWKNFHILQSSAKKYCFRYLLLQATWLHAPLYLPIRRLSVKSPDNDHYDFRNVDWTAFLFIPDLSFIGLFAGLLFTWKLLVAALFYFASIYSLEFCLQVKKQF